MKNINKFSFLLILLFLFIILFSIFKPLIEGYKYGCVPLEQSYMFDKNNYWKLLNELPNKSLIKFKNWPDFNKDYINLHLPKAEIITKFLNNEKEQPFDTTRLLGLSLYGHPLTDMFNPLNYVFRYCDNEDFIVYKSITYLCVGFVTIFYFLKCLNISSNLFILVSGSVIFLLMPNNFHYLHWDNYIGITMILPILYLGILYLVRSRYFTAFVFFTFYGYLSITINMVEIFFYNTLFAIIFLIVFVIVNDKEWSIYVKSFYTFIASIFTASLLAMPQIYSNFEYLNLLQREGTFSLSMIDFKYPYYPRNKGQYLGLIGMPCLWKTQHTLMFNVSILFIILLNIYYYNRLGVFIKCLLYTFLLCIIFLFVGFIDLPLYKIEFYNMFANQVRSLNTITFFASILFINGLSNLLHDLRNHNRNKIKNIFKKILFLNIIVLCIYIYIIINPNKFIFLEQYSHYFSFRYSFLIFIASFGFPIALLMYYKSIITYKYFLLLLPILISIPYIIYAKVVVPYYKLSDVIELNSYNKRNFSTRSIIINKEAQNIKARDWQSYLGTFMWSMGENPITGYDTGLTKTSARLLHEFWSKSDYNELKFNNKFSWINWHEYWVPASPSSFINFEGNSARIKKKLILKLKLLGVSRIYSNYLLPDLITSSTISDYNLYDLNLSSPFSIVHGYSKEQISKFLINSKTNDLNDSSVINLSSEEFFLKENGLLTFNLSTKNGFLILPYDLPSNFYIKDSDDNFIEKDALSGIYIIDLSKYNNFSICSDYNRIVYIYYFSIFLLLFFTSFILFKFYHSNND